MRTTYLSSVVEKHPVYINVNSLYFEPFGNLSLLFQHFKLVRTYLEKTKAIIILS